MRWTDVRLPIVAHLEEWFSCGESNCRSHGRVWRHLARPAHTLRLKGVRHCFPECFESALEQRLADFSNTAPSRKPSHRIPLGLLMLSRGEITQSQLRQALQAQKNAGSGRIGEWMARLGFAMEEQVTGALGAQWSCPVLRELPVAPINCGIPQALLRHFRMLPVYYSRSAQVLHLAFSRDVEYSVLLGVEQALGCRAEACVTSASGLEKALTRMEDNALKETLFAGISTSGEMSRIVSGYAGKFRADDVRVAACAAYVWVRMIRGAEGVNLLFLTQVENTPKRNLALHQSAS